jgi:putative transposase
MEKGKFITKTCKRFNFSGHAHELTFSCYRNRKFLLSDRTCRWLIESIERAREKHNFSLWAFVFMPDHVHLLINPTEKEYNISNILKDIKTDTARKTVKYLKENNPSELLKLSTDQQYRKYRFWQKGGGYDRNIIKESTLIDSVKYIHNNPVRKNLVDEPEKWYYSSYNCWINGVNEPIRIDKETWPLF